MDRQTIHTIYKNFLNELEEANRGKQTSLPFIKNTIPTRLLTKESKIFQVIVIGGSVFRSALVKKDSSEFILTEEEVGTLPSFPDKESFLNFIENHVRDKLSILAINLAYPLSPVFENNKLDGVLLSTGKGNTFTGLVGKKVGEEIEKYLYKKRGQQIRVSIANDTIALLLSGLTKYSWDEIAAGIVGTGTNFAFVINENTLVNLESSDFNKLGQSEAGKIIDKMSVNPERQFLEKEMSGKFLPQHFNYFLRENHIKFNNIENAKQLDGLARLNIPIVSDEARRLFERSAQFMACVAAGILSFCKRDLYFIMQGSVFWKGYRYKETVEAHVHELEPRYNASFIHIESSDILGAAKLVA